MPCFPPLGTRDTGQLIYSVLCPFSSAQRALPHSYKKHKTLRVFYVMRLLCAALSVCAIKQSGDFPRCALARQVLNSSAPVIIMSLYCKCTKLSNHEFDTLAFFFSLMGKKLPATCAILVEWAGAPGQGVLEGVEEVPQHPGNNGVVEEADQEGHNHGRNSFKNTHTYMLANQIRG